MQLIRNLEIKSSSTITWPCFTLIYKILTLVNIVLARDPCLNFDCGEGGRCVSPTDIPTCVCMQGYKYDNTLKKCVRHGKCSISPI